MSSSVGLIGLGNMGAYMADNIHKIMPTKSMFYDIEPANVAKIKGARGARSVSELAQSSDIIVTMLPNTKHVMTVCRGEDGIFKNAKAGSIFIDCSTIDPIASRELSEEAKACGIDMLDAPVSGGVLGAQQGTLTFMVGGLESTLQRAKPILQLMGKNIVYCGGAGNGEITKLCNNLSLAISMIGTSEAMALGVRLGMDPKTLAGVMNTSTARCWSSDTYNPCPNVMPNVPSSRGNTQYMLSIW
jgi:3-hydroxyisobutyrate dehydrogenase